MTTWRSGRTACTAALSLAAMALGCGGGSGAPSAPAATSSRSTSTITAWPVSGWPTPPTSRDSSPAARWPSRASSSPPTAIRTTSRSSPASIPDGNDVPANDWLGRDNDFMSPVMVGGELDVGDYAVWDKNPLRVRGDSVYSATHAAGGRSAYVGELPPFEAGADDVHLSIVGTMFDTPLGTLTVDATTAKNLLTNSLGYPSSIANGYSYDGPPESGETQTRFTLRAAADYIRNHPMPAFMFVWDFVALDDDVTSVYGADGAAARADHRGLRRRPGRAARRAHRQEPARQHQHPLHAGPRQGRHPQPGGPRYPRGRQRRRADGRAGDVARRGDGARHLQLRAPQRGRRRADLRQRPGRRHAPAARRRRPTSPTSCSR